MLVVAALLSLFLFQAANMGLGAYVLGLARHEWPCGGFCQQHGGRSGLDGGARRGIVRCTWHPRRAVLAACWWACC